MGRLKRRVDAVKFLSAAVIVQYLSNPCKKIGAISGGYRKLDSAPGIAKTEIMFIVRLSTIGCDFVKAFPRSVRSPLNIDQSRRMTAERTQRL
jgi:hypothetical protein